MTLASLAPTDLASATGAALADALARIGWSLEYLDLDLDADRARMEVAAGELAVILDARPGSVTLTREHRRFNEHARGAGRYSGRWDVQLLGRSRHEGIRSALRTLADYVQDNAPAAPRLAAREALRGTLRSGVAMYGRRSGLAALEAEANQ